MTKTTNKLGIIVPFRNRHEHLDFFLSQIEEYLEKNGFDYVIIIVEQDNAKQFNRGMLLNIGFKYAKKMKCDYVVFHDVDMIPFDVDYSYSDKPLHLSTKFISESNEEKRTIFKEYFGGVTLFPVEVFEKINGYSNKYWGWGFEDDDLLLRCKINDVELDKMRLMNSGKNGKTLKFNGVDAYVEVDNIIDFRYNGTFVITFDMDQVVYNHEKDSDEFTAFSVPGWDFAISYTSFNRYNFCAFDSNKKAYYINSEITPSHKTTIAVVMDMDEKRFKMYKDGVLIGVTEEFKKLYPYNKEKKFYIGVGKKDRDSSPNYLKGMVSSFAYYDDILGKEEIREISSTKTLLNELESKEKLKLYYDTNHIKNYKLTDLTGNGNDGKIVNCEIIEKVYDECVEVKIPHRRKGHFISLNHEQNGFDGNGWKDKLIRWNQLRFKNEITLNPELTKEDGLSDLEFVEWGVKKNNKITHINVGI